MYVQRKLPLKLVLVSTLRPTLRASAWTAAVYFLYAHFDLSFLRLPFLPVATIGTAVAFYVGFKNNSAYERFWEGRKIWGGIINESRHWATSVLSFLREDSDADRAAKRRLLLRQVAWVNALRIQLRKKSRFAKSRHIVVRKRLERSAAHLRQDWEVEVAPLLDSHEADDVRQRVNPAAHLLKLHARDLDELREKRQISEFEQLALLRSVRELHGFQGKCERIKNTPLPRQYAEFSRHFVAAFVALVPLGLLSVFHVEVDASLNSEQILGVFVPMLLSASIVTWVYSVMEGIGDASEDPFERSMSDVPLNSLCRTIERDLRDMLDEEELPPPEEPIDGLLY